MPNFTALVTQIQDATPSWMAILDILFMIPSEKFIKILFMIPLLSLDQAVKQVEPQKGNYAEYI